MSQSNRLRYKATNRDPAVGPYAQPSYSTSNWSPTGGGLFRYIWVSVTGNVYTLGADGSLGVFKNVPVGMWPIGGATIVAANDGTNPTTATIDTVGLEG